MILVQILLKGIFAAVLFSGVSFLVMAYGFRKGNKMREKELNK
jgi:hypothetical protein